MKRFHTKSPCGVVQVTPMKNINLNKKILISVQKETIRITCGASYHEQTNLLLLVRKIPKIQDIYICFIAIFNV